MTDVGYVSFDLVIKSRLEAQLEKIRSEAQKPAKKLGEAIGRAISESMNKADVSIPEIEMPKFEKEMEIPEVDVPQVEIPKADTSAFEQSAEEINEIVKRAVERMNKPVIEAEIAAGSPEPVKPKKYISYDPKKIQAEIDQSLSESAEKFNNEIREKLGEYEVPTEPVERLEKEIGNSKEKLELLQKKWQELSASDPTDKTRSQLQSVQQQIISTTNKIDKLKEKLNKMTAEKAVEIKPEISDNFQTEINEMAKAAKPVEIKTELSDGIKKKADEAANAAKSKFENASRAAGKNIEKNLGDSFGRVKNKASKSMSSIAAHINKLSVPIQKFRKNLASAFKSVFIMAALYAGFRAIKDGFAEAIKADNKFIASLNEVKANLSIAFMPVIQTVMPILNTLMTGLAAVTKSIASFISGLFGTTYKQSSEAVKKLKATADAAKKVKLSMAGIDEMNILSSSDNEQENVKKESIPDLGSGDAGAEKLGSKVKNIMSAAFETIKEKGKEVFKGLGEWADTSFSPTFEGIWDGLKAETEELLFTLDGIFSDIMSLGEPLKAYFSGDFTEWLGTCFETYGMIAVGLFDTFNTVFSDIWNIAVFPILSSFIKDGLPVITQFSTQSVKTLGTLFTAVKKNFDMIWNDAAKPVLKFIADKWQDVMESVKAFWDKWGEPIFEKLRKAIENCGDTFRKIWNSFLKPVFDKLMETADKLWDKHLKPLVDNLLDFVGEWINAALDIYNEFIAPVVSWFAEKFGPPIAELFGWVFDKIGEYIGGIIDAVSSIIDALKGVVNFVAGVFTGDWDRAWNGIKDIFGGVWDAVANLLKYPINAVIDLINGLIGAVKDGLNWIIDGLNNFGFEIPEWLGGGSVGFALPYIDVPEIPHLANGGLATEPTLAMVGDNRNARTDPEVIAPLSKLSGMLGGDTGEIIELLKLIVELLRNGMNIEIINYLFKGSSEFSREVLKAVRNDRIRKGEL